MNNMSSYCGLVHAKKELLTKIYLYQQQSKAERSNERTEQRTAPEEDFYDYGSIHLPFCLVAVVISVAGAAATRPPPTAAVSPPT
jgi:hypothetical protein